MSYPTYQYVSLDRLLAEAKTELRLDHTNTEDPYLIRYVLEGAKEMMTALDFVEKTVYLDICDFVAVLPCDFVKFDRPNPLTFTINGTPIQGGYYAYGWNVIYTGGSYLTCSPFDWNPSVLVPTINVQNGKIYFSNNVDAPQCAISYMAINTTPEGVVLVPEINGRPIVAYAAYKYKRSVSEPYADFQREWYKGKLHRKSLANLPDWFINQQCNLIFNTLNYATSK